MTSRSLKKHLTTARTFRPAKRLSLSLLLMGAAVTATAQTPYRPPLQNLQPSQGAAHFQVAPGQSLPAQRLMPVPRASSQVPQTPANPQRPGWNLKWRRSAKAPVQQVIPAANANAMAPQANEPVSAASPVVTAVTAASHAAPLADPPLAARSSDQLRVAANAPQLRSAPQAQMVSRAGHVSQSVSPAQGNVQLTQAQSDGPRRGLSRGNERDFFENPFGDDPQPGELNASIPVAAPQQQEMLLPPEPTVDPALPSDSRPMNQLRGVFDSLNAPDEVESGLPAPARSQPQSSRSAAPRQSQADNGPSLGDMLRERQPDLAPAEQSDEELRSPRSNRDSNRPADDPFDNPFERRDRSADEQDRDRLNTDPSDDDDRYAQEDDDLRMPAQLTCGDFRRRIAEQTIDQLSLDISPPYRPDEIDIDEYKKLKEEFDEKQVIRSWRSIDGRELASGRLRDLAYEKAVIETEYGTMEEIAINRLSEGDIAYISENWQLPRECLIEQVAYAPRTWASTTMTWKASNLCHTPLYFEDVNLERYGHTHGPLLEPIVQSAHFFGSIVVLPYKMGVHCPSECQYPLGYYRPGNCAPWITPAVPISARGAIAQAAAMTGMFWLIP